MAPLEGQRAEGLATEGFSIRVARAETALAERANRVLTPREETLLQRDRRVVEGRRDDAHAQADAEDVLLAQRREVRGREPRAHELELGAELLEGELERALREAASGRGEERVARVVALGPDQPRHVDPRLDVEHVLVHRLDVRRGRASEAIAEGGRVASIPLLAEEGADAAALACEGGLLALGEVHAHVSDQVAAEEPRVGEAHVGAYGADGHGRLRVRVDPAPHQVPVARAEGQAAELVAAEARLRVDLHGGPLDHVHEDRPHLAFTLEGRRDLAEEPSAIEIAEALAQLRRVVDVAALDAHAGGEEARACPHLALDVHLAEDHVGPRLGDDGEVHVACPAVDVDADLCACVRMAPLAEGVDDRAAQSVDHARLEGPLLAHPAHDVGEGCEDRCLGLVRQPLRRARECEGDPAHPVERPRIHLQAHVHGIAARAGPRIDDPRVRVEMAERDEVLLDRVRRAGHAPRDVEGRAASEQPRARTGDVPREIVVLDGRAAFDHDAHLAEDGA